MKNIVAISIAALFLFSCKKSEQENDINKESKKIQVTFTTGFETSTKDITSTSDDGDLASRHLNYIYYTVYTQAGQKVKSITQIKGITKNFGLLIDTLPAGIYNAFFLGSKVPLNFNVSTFDKSYVNNYDDKDIFFTRDGFVLDQNPIRRGATFVRAVGKLTFEFKDLIPSNVTRIEIKRRAASKFFFNESAPLDTIKVKTINLPANHAPLIIDPFSLTTVESNTWIELEIAAYATNGDLVQRKKLDVQPRRNRESVITGFLLSELESLSFVIDGDWDPGKNIIEWW